MKKTILVIFALFAFASSFAKTTIIYNKIERNIHHISTSSEGMRTGFTDTCPMDISTSVFVSPLQNDTTYTIELKLYSMKSLYFNKGALVLIKTITDDVMELNVESFREGNISRSIYSAPFSPSIYVTLTKDQLKQLCTQGIKKLRLQESKEVIDKEYKVDTIKKIIIALRDQRELLEKTLVDPEAEQDKLKEDF